MPSTITLDVKMSHEQKSYELGFYAGYGAIACPNDMIVVPEGVDMAKWFEGAVAGRKEALVDDATPFAGKA